MTMQRLINLASKPDEVMMSQHHIMTRSYEPISYILVYHYCHRVFAQKASKHISSSSYQKTMLTNYNLLNENYLQNAYYL